MFKKVVIFGVGLIGGSFALALRRAGQAAHIVGVGRSLASLERARELGIIDAIATDAAAAVTGADLILVAAPVAQTEAILASIKPHLEARAIVTDAGSTKSDVVAAARKAMGERIAQFVPAHPIAGREKHGPEAALAELYEGKKVVITALPENSESDVETVAAAWRACGAIIHRLSPQEHDAVFASVSHLPHVLAFALVDDIAAKPHAGTLFQYAASGFRDFTRIAASSPEMWRDITLANRDALLTEVDAYLVQLQGIRAMIADSDGAGLEKIYANAQHARQQWAAAIEAAERKAN
ncbi:prephenate dehydrogenase/arogenate dehydrogenase family protein [Herbaspirillum huttiense F1]|uniref:Prephenate dehydrogenase/arogenate dehydrogenase family protein n=1 Tax=Herbaspirillum huttiense subsp. lycopersici TaxID=3074428 RepID=A0ABU2EKW8_9BURK|nr:MULTISPECIES: prephenate dehydrogenase/arogenate dehydrogenase family protein [Herbaspirillum]MBP1316850.1 prephenate dehydrogenase [Herbaspirillum sp. 1130]MCO4855774.1 prephenate dehydrogenase/arogenate dehydrogenase family protein [Herbaspirillum sp. WGmk3]MDR6740140.1 prephenate dehydrogenase [Herbaspirillum sp. 1173]MDR9848472.1 prephenate dehydrogenase/arogenate dehydrogenase family protein [Herbaspirillum huttiense SE1]MDT0356254.1 prephenate dehydrogenase/arogenate dehydrogenase fam